MACEEIPEAGEPIIKSPEVEDTLSSISQTNKVIVCDLCARCFLEWIGDVDNLPLTMWLLTPKYDGQICGGALRMVSRRTALEIADRYEQIGEEAWLRGQRKPNQP